MKKTLLIFLILFIIVPVFALSDVFLKDVAIRIGDGNFLWDDYSEMGVHFLGGMTFGLTKRLECAFEAITPLVPGTFSDFVVGSELSYCLIGDRVSGSNLSGSNINSMLSLGVFCSKHNKDNKFVPTYLTLRLNLCTFGTPYNGRREHILPIGCAWNFVDNTFSMFVSVLMYDHYIKGSWRDYL